MAPQVGMGIDRFAPLAIAIATLVNLIVGASEALAAETCRAPRYRVGQRWEDSPAAIAMSLSMHPEDFAPARLLCIGRLLADRYRDRREMEFLIFSSRQAAEQWTAGNEGDFDGARRRMSRAAAEGELRARLWREPTGEEFIEVNPLDPALRSRLQLRSSSSQSCRHEVDHRCLLSVGDLSFAPTGARVSGRAEVTFNARISKRGSVRVRRVVSGAAPPDVIAAAQRHLEAWRFEVAREVSSFDVNYVFEQDTTMPIGLRTIDFHLPERVTIRQP